jgi:hypothetical protein
VSGLVTNNSNAVAGATVTAENVNDDGSTTDAGGSSTTGSDGSYDLELENAADIIVVAAEQGAFDSSVLVYTRNRSSVQAMDMTAETDAEAEVYVEAKGEDTEDDVTVSDVVLYVTAEVAEDIQSGAVTVSDAATAIHAAASAEAEYLREEAADELDDVQEAKADAFFEFQADVAGAANPDPVIEAYEEALIEAYADADVSAETHAHARLAARSAIEHAASLGSASAAVRAHLRHKAEVMAAWSSALAIEAAFQAWDTAYNTGELVDTREELVAAIEGSSSTTVWADAYADYRAVVREQLAVELGVSAGVITTALSTTNTATVALEEALEDASSAADIVEAYVAFYTAAEAAAAASLGGAGASFGASVLTLLVAQ